MSTERADIDAAIDRVLLFRPGATLSQIRSLLPAVARLPNDELGARVERLRSRLVRKSRAQNQRHTAGD